MQTAVRYFTRSGNTQKLADAIAKAVKADAKPITEDLPEKVDVLFLGSSLYKFTFEPAVGEFLKRNAAKIGKLVLFGTSASGKSTMPQLKPVCEQLSIPLCEREFVCVGKFLFAHKGRPNDADAAAAASFAKEIVK